MAAVAVIAVVAVILLSEPDAPTTELAAPASSSPAPPAVTPATSTPAAQGTPETGAASEREPVVAATPTATSQPTTPPTPDPPRVAMVVGEAGSLNASERLLRDHLRTRGYLVTTADDDDPTSHGDQDLIVISKTVESTAVGNRYTETAAGMMTWEDNAQAIEQGGSADEQGTGTPMLSWIDLVNPDDTAWHAPDQTWHLDPEAPAELRAGMKGSTPIYTSTGETTYAPAGALPDAATVVASIDEGDPRTTYYVYDEGAQLADGTPSPGRRVYFGLYDDTFAQLTPEGLALFDAAVSWAADS